MADNMQKNEIVILASDSEESDSGMRTKEKVRKRSPLTSIKTKSNNTSSSSKAKSNLFGNTRVQTSLEQYFTTFTVESKSSLVDNRTLSKSASNSTIKSANNESKPKTVSSKLFTAVKSTHSQKRSSEKGLSPASKQSRALNESSSTPPAPLLCNLKGRELWAAINAQRQSSHKQTIITGESDDLEECTGDDIPIEDLLMTTKLVHSYPGEKSKKASDITEVQPLYPPDIKLVDDPHLGSQGTLFKPKQKIIIKTKKKVPVGDILQIDDLPCILKTSTPQKPKNYQTPELSTLDMSSDLEFQSSLFSDSALDTLETPKKSKKKVPLCQDYGRFTVTDCSHGVSNTIMLLRDTAGNTRTCELEGFWMDAPVKTGHIVNILGDFGEDGHIRIGMDNDLMIVVQPDFLVSGSVIASATQCLRRSVLNNRYKGYDAANKYMLFGSILHEIFQKVLVSNITDEMEMRKLAQVTAHNTSYAHSMYAIDMPEKALMDGIDEYLPSMSSFLKKHVGEKATEKIKILEITDIEETIWSPRFGIKGKIDVTVGVENSVGIRRKVPLELKTGRPSFSAEHKGQVTMYSMMLNEKLGWEHTNAIPPGLLVYLKDGSMQEVANNPHAMKGLVNLRNELCNGLLLGITKTGTKAVDYKIDKLPDPINQSRVCSTCPQLLTCTLHQKVYRDFRTSESHVMDELVPDTLAHLSESHLAYFNRWSSMLLIEASEETKWKTISSLWCKTIEERESQGTCVSGLSIQKVEELSPSAYSHTFSLPSSLSANTKLTAGSLVVISEGNHVVIISTGSITAIIDNTIIIVLDRKLSTESKYCIDIYDYYTGEGTGFTNLARLMENTPQSAHLRELLIDKREPQFFDLIDEHDEEKVEGIIADLNSDQQEAVQQAMLTKDYLVVKGYPGTGKTSTIVAIVKAFRKLGLSVLITSYTNSAVDNILLKLKQTDIEFLRLGRTSRIHAGVKENSAEYLTKDLHTVDEVRNFYQGYHVVGTTCLAISHPMLIKRQFDVCIIDEASQILIPVCIGPLFYAKRFIIVGDSHQLPPLVKSEDAKTLGMEKTLLDELSCEQATVELTYQYRMNEELMRLSNTLVYDMKLKCGTTDIQPSVLAVHGTQVDAVDSTETWDWKITSSKLPHSTLLLNTSHCAPTPVKKNSIHSSTEAKLVKYVCNKLHQAGVDGSCIGVITPYQAQVQLLRKLLNVSNVEVNTVDQYQGRDKSVIVISFARTTTSGNNSSSSAGILSDIRRLNVAITRAKHKLILIGNITVLASYQPVNSLLTTLRPHQMIIVPYNWADTEQ